jgi:hypothetical protein
MKIVIVIFMVFTSVFALNAQENASCRDFTQDGVTILTDNDFLPDGRFNSVKLSQGDKIEIYKPFYSGRDYLLVITAAENLPGITVEIKDISRKVIFQSDESNSLQEFNYTPERNQNLIISVKVTTSEELEETEIGCVAVVVGFQ